MPFCASDTDENHLQADGGIRMAFATEVYPGGFG